MSALSEADPNSLQELMERDSLSLTDADVEAIVAHYRQLRENWKRVEAKGKKVKPPVGTSVQDILGDLNNLIIPE